MPLGVVHTTFGSIIGTEYGGDYEGIAIYKGVPYAAPPVGRLRFAPPEDPKPWEGIRSCQAFAPAPVQTMLSDRHAREYYYMGTPDMSEDCLYLNICSGAAWAGEKRPVFLWFHGGGLTNCYSYEVQFNPQVLAKKGIVVVTVGQRLNLFGYLCLPQLTKEQGSSGNYGFMDQIKALDWITDNIAVFGGDPDNITVGGQSGGALKCCALAASPASGGRVKRVINQSGNKWMIPFGTLEEEEQRGLRYLEYAGLKSDITLEELRALDMAALYRDAPRVVMPGTMVCDGNLVLYGSVREMFEHGLENVDFINGSDYGEAELFAASRAGLGQMPGQKEILTAYDFYNFYKNLLGPLYEKYAFADLVPVTDENALGTAVWLANHGLCGSEGMNVSRNLMLNRYFGMYMHRSHPGSRYYSYLWTHLLPCLPEDKHTALDPEQTLAWHSTELWFTFSSLRDQVPPHRPWRDLDYELADKISSYWANFMKNGDPNGASLPLWPPSHEAYGYMILGDEFQGRKGIRTPLDNLILEFVRAEYGLEELAE